MNTIKSSLDQNDLNTVLILSRDSDMARVWKMLFEQRNCNAVHETSLREGLQASRLLSPALIVLDLDLPNKERLEFCRSLRATTNGTIVLISSAEKNLNVLEYQQAGVDETLSASMGPMALVIKSLAWLARQDWLVPRKNAAGMFTS